MARERKPLPGERRDTRSEAHERRLGRRVNWLAVWWAVSVALWVLVALLDLVGKLLDFLE